MADSIHTFFSAWGMTDEAERSAAIASAMSDTGSYADPRTQDPLIGPAPIAEYVAFFATAAPGAVAEVVHDDIQHGFTRATVAFRMANGMEQFGQYFVQTDEKGQIASMIGFAGTGTPE
ncbi:molecular chaperone GroEL [Alphaproteobacteria bacterium KMM 3653]|uniref:Molecular chaperone GroEL n=1 Tax=Harenicola maris TaxID=2841044 RepID=A0AAP2CK32_9RHOB|nr:molecular chaperone GroEL [Harenicola maris]